MGMMAGETADNRERAERNKIVHAEPKEERVLGGGGLGDFSAAVGRFSDARQNPSDKLGMIAHDDKYRAKNPNWLGASRPRYAALNYSNNPNGAVADEALYGLSCFVLKNHLKNLATYCAADSASHTVTAKKICTRRTLGALLLWMEERMLINLRNAYLKQPTEDLIKQKHTYDFLECHMYSDVTFHADVKEMHLSEREVGKNKKAFKYAKKFAKRWNIPVVMVP
jgi:hypothetical protein